MGSNEFKGVWDIEVFTTLAKASLKEGGWISYKNVYENEQPRYGILHFGVSIDNLVGCDYIHRVGTKCSLTEKGLKRYNELQGA